MYNLGKNIKELRNSLKLTQTEFAKKLNTTRNVVSLWEINYRDPSISMFRSICETFGVSFDELLELDL